MMQPLWKTVWWFRKKLNIELVYSSATLLLVMYIYSKEMKAGMKNRLSVHRAHSNIVHSSQKVESAHVPPWMNE